MASRLRQLRSKAAHASEFIAKHICAYHKELLEKNKHQIVQPSTIEACPVLWKKLHYTRLARNNIKALMLCSAWSYTHGSVSARLWEEDSLSLATISKNKSTPEFLQLSRMIKLCSTENS